MGEVDTNWNAIYNELLRWQTLLETTTLIKHIPYSYGTNTLYDDGQATNQADQHNQHHNQREGQDERIHDNHQQWHNTDAREST